ncbi:MAG TPA: hypothetical protein V6C88_01605, partial [Chroococcidiopsis sp.]
MPAPSPLLPFTLHPFTLSLTPVGEPVEPLPPSQLPPSPVSAAEPPPLRLYFTVEDTGPGIAPN